MIVLMNTFNDGWSGLPFKVAYAGVSVTPPKDNITTLTLAVRDVIYPMDYIQKQLRLPPQKPDAVITDSMLDALREYSESRFVKVTGIGMPAELISTCPHLTSRLWLENDIIPLVVDCDKVAMEGDQNTPWGHRALDEQAEVLAMKCVRVFGPLNIPILQVGYRGLVEVNSHFHMHIASSENYQNTVGAQTWDILQIIASEVRPKELRIALFSATPQGGGVALIRHAFVRLGRLLDLDIKYNRYWASDGGPLDDPSNGGADIIVVDHPQMPDLIQIAKERSPARPVIYRSHIQIRTDLAETPHTPQARTWNWLWKRAQHADIFISHPIPDSVPRDVPKAMVGYIPASTDILDGLNKDMRDWDIAHYGRIFNQWCKEAGMPTVDYPTEKYFAQVARFDPSKGLFDALDGYSMFYDHVQKTSSSTKVPKLVICGHGSVDDPDATGTYQAVLERIDEKMPRLKDLICVIRAKPSDQVLNAILSKAKIILQLSTCEGFEIKVSEALRKGKPVIATNVGGLPYRSSITKLAS
ncbi:Trehalose phosphorylase [Penicillium oxalicum]|uniref:Trehalose phosphorylase n=1 Tax=Penicillium oxalicum TaxID=69781 RepID=UPI0020B83F95|nr:Trehalose phosphorylase [Penicillium oxalicum]KAI2791897.1 Trehalose phosphorylase [Penicillium oxalicum]